MTKTNALLLALCAGLVVGTPVLAKPHGEKMTFSTLDANGDGQISQDEMKARAAERFTRTDTDGDGFLSTAEIEAAGSERAKKRSAKMIKHLDADGDGKLSQEEMTKRSPGDRFFKRFDADSNGTISEEEFASAQDKMKKRRAKE